VSITIDTNVLVYADNEDDPIHVRARSLLADIAAGPGVVVLFWPVIIGYLRIVTNRGAVPTPIDPRDAHANVDALLALPHVRTRGERDGFWDVYRQAVDDQTRGNLVSDAHIAALMRQHGVRTIYTRDRDFRRFDGIEALDPFA
jgi:toxin-antitoxin system PIN domain toxin